MPIIWFLKRAWYKLFNPKLFDEARRDLDIIAFHLKGLLSELESIPRKSTEDHLDNLVRFFKNLSPLEDDKRVTHLIQKMKRIGATSLVTHGHVVTLHTLESLARCIEFGGRHKYGMNRSERYGDVTDKCVYVGDDRRGIATHPVRVWKMMKNLDGSKGTSYRIACNVAHEYLDKHLPVTIDVIRHIVRTPPVQSAELLMEVPRPLTLQR